MMQLDRRSFFYQAAVGLTAFGAQNEFSERAEAQLVWRSPQWNIAGFWALVKDVASVKQVCDVTRIGDGKFLDNMKNTLNGLRYGFGIPVPQIKLVAGLHGPANLINYDDYVWEKYRVGEWLEVTDPATGKPATRNIFYPAKTARQRTATPQDPSDPNSVYQDASVQTLQARGVEFLSCHTALEEQVRALVARDQLRRPTEEIVQDMLAHALPGVLVVASMGAAIALLQAQGHYTYITV